MVLRKGDPIAAVGLGKNSGTPRWLIVQTFSWNKKRTLGVSLSVKEKKRVFKDAARNCFLVLFTQLSVRWREELFYIQGGGGWGREQIVVSFKRDMIVEVRPAEAARMKIKVRFSSADCLNLVLRIFFFPICLGMSEFYWGSKPG